MSFWTALPRPIVGLAPMDGVTDATFRRLVARAGKPDVTFTEFTHVNDICRAPDFLLDSLIYSEEERPIVAQIYGKDPELFCVAAQVVGALGFDGLDINMGCPSRSVASSGSGAGLIRTPELARAIVQATQRGLDAWATGAPLPTERLRAGRVELIGRMNEVRSGSTAMARRVLPLSIKTRLGFEADIIDWWMAWLLESQPAAITIHGRTLEQMYRGRADWAAIARAVDGARGSGTLVLGNGDIQSLAEAAVRIQETGVNGVLVGRSALGEPWFFRDLARGRAAWIGGAAPPREALNPPVPRAVRCAAMLDHARLFESLCDRSRFQHIRKHLAWYCKGFPHAAAMRTRLVRASSSDDVAAIIQEFEREFPAVPAGVGLDASSPLGTSALPSPSAASHA